MHLVENEDDVERLQVADPERLAYVTQTTLSIDDCERVIAALEGAAFRRSWAPRRTTSATPRRTARTR